MPKLQDLRSPLTLRSRLTTSMGAPITVACTVVILTTCGTLVGSRAAAGEIECHDLFLTKDAATIGILESAIENQRSTAARQRREAASLLARLNLANDGWWPLDQGFTANIETLVAQYRSVERITYRTTNQRNRKLGKIRRTLEATLLSDPIFPKLNHNELGQLKNRLLTRAELGEQNGLNGIKHVLYRSIYFADPTPAPMLREVLLSVDAIARLVSRIEDQRIVKMQTLIAARGAKSVGELRQRRNSLIATINDIITKTRPIPEDVITSSLSAAKQYRYARTHGATTDAAELQWRRLVETNSFFGGLAEGDVEAIGFEWAKTTTRESVIKMFVINTSAGSPALALRYRDLDEIDLALDYLETP